MGKVIFIFFVILLLGLVNAQEVLNINLKDKNYSIKIHDMGKGIDPFDDALLNVNREVFEIFSYQRKVIDDLGITPGKIKYSENESFINLSFHFEGRINKEDPKILFKINEEDYSIELVSVVKKFPFDEGIIEVGGMPVQIIQSQKKSIKGLEIIPVSIKEDSDNSYVNLSVDFERRLYYNLVVENESVEEESSVSEEIDEVISEIEDGSGEAIESEEKKSEEELKSFFDNTEFIVIVVIINIALVTLAYLYLRYRG